MKLLRTALARTLAGAAALVLLLWAAGILATDRWLLTQYIYWLPTWALLAPCAALLLGARLIALRRRSALRAAAWLGWAAGLVYLLLVDLRLTNIAAPAAHGPSLRILHWNVTNITDLTQVQRELAAARPNIAVLVDIWGDDWRPVIDSFAEPSYILREHGMLVLSDAPIRRSGFAWLGLAALPPDAPVNWQPRASRSDPGRALFLEIQSPLLDRSQIIWVLDMPSDWRKSRWKMATHARGVIESWTGVVTRSDETGHFWREPHDGRGFPKPDIVVGDFNIPRGSASLDVLMPGMRHAFDQAGWGYAATFPNRRPLLHIDHTFIAPPLRAASYDLVNPGPSTHRLQVTQITAPGAKPAGGVAQVRPQQP